MIDLLGQDILWIKQQTQEYIPHWHNSVLSCLTKYTKSFTHPPEIASFLNDLNKLVDCMHSAFTSHNHSFAPGVPLPFDDELAPIIKTVIASQRRRLASQLESEQEAFTHAGVRTSIERNLQPFESITLADWFQTSRTRRAPRLSDFLTTERIEEAQKDRKLRDRVYDEKFHILMSPSLCLSDLAYYREKCEARDIPISMAFIDIDDFKSFNTDYKEPIVDLHLLPRFMRAVESHLFFRGFGYRFGGDEYVILLPNACSAITLNVLKSLQDRIAALKYDGGISRRPTASIGYCVIDPDCWLTERELLERAATAKNFAKKQGKNRIATFSDSRFDEADLTIAHPELQTPKTA